MVASGEILLGDKPEIVQTVKRQGLFRVKQSRDSEGREITTIYDLDASFQVILAKLDNVDEAKRSSARDQCKVYRYARFMQPIGNCHGDMVHPAHMFHQAERGHLPGDRRLPRKTSR